MLTVNVLCCLDFPKGLLETGVVLLVWEAAEVNPLQGVMSFPNLNMLLRLYWLLLYVAFDSSRICVLEPV